MAVITYASETHQYPMDASATVADLKIVVALNLNLPIHTQKLLCKGKVLRDDDQIPTGKIMLLASSERAIAAVQAAARTQAESNARRAASTIKKIGVASTQKQSSTFRFHEIKALSHLQDPGRAQKYLERLAQDPSIIRLMERHKLSVGLLTEMDPRLHTTHSSKTLGLNKNAGAEILLRLRTDELDGYRDYAGVKSTLIHELVHNRFGEHDRNFWDLFRDWSAEIKDMESGQQLAHGDIFESTKIDTHCRSETKKLLGKDGTGPSSREDRARAAERRMGR